MGVASGSGIEDGKGLDSRARRIVGRRSRHLMAMRRSAVKRGDPASIHDLRVATRRLQEALDLFAPVLPGRESHRLRRRARRVRRHLAALRDADVVAEIAASFPEARSMLRALALAPMALRTRARAGDGGVRVPGIRKRIASFNRASALSSPALPLPASVRGRAAAIEALGRRAAKVETILAGLRIDRKEEAHALRVAVKRYRYTLELLDEAGIARPGAALEEARRVQEALGKVHDLDVLIDLIRRRRDGRAWMAALRLRRRAAAATAQSLLRRFRPWRLE
jgi:CHAD domain-containing protein